MMTVYDLNDKGEIVNAMLEHMAQQIENPALTLFQLGGGGGIHPLQVFPRHRHKNQPINSKLSDF